MISDLARGCKELIRGNEEIKRNVQLVCCGRPLWFFAVDSGVVLIQVKWMLSLLKGCEGCFD